MSITLKKSSFSATFKGIGQLLIIVSLFAASTAHSGPEQTPATIAESPAWQQTLASAKGQTVYFNAWGGSETINEYIRWAAKQVKSQYGVTVKQVKVTDTGNVVSRLLAEKSAGRTFSGSIDLVWINGENFKSMKDNGLLAQPYTQQLPNYLLVDTENKPSTLYDFTTAVDNLEAPWGMAQLVFMYDTAHINNHPQDMQSLLSTLQGHRGRFSYPAPPSFHGTSFIKQALIELIADKSLLSKPVVTADFSRVTAPLWAYLDQLHPLMWRSGRSFPSSAGQMKNLLNNGELFISLSFNPNDASNAIANDELPESIKTYVHSQGTLGNTHFVAIPFNATAKEGAKVFANFLMSPAAQVRKASPQIWGDPTVLAMHKLTQAQRQSFSELPLGQATLTTEQLGTVLLEPHASWVAALEQEWLSRYAK
ncbi:MAG: ABC transporter substrate-binding protein [Pseudomonadales bacterium]|nr:ABC transporter substrate-binding protein [Pseudomonadales bacterium]